MSAAPTTYTHFLEELDAAGFVSVWSPGGGDHARALWLRWFCPALPAARTISLDELTQKPQGGDDFILDLIADAQAHDERRAL